MHFYLINYNIKYLKSVLNIFLLLDEAVNYHLILIAKKAEDFSGEFKKKLEF